VAAYLTDHPPVRRQWYENRSRPLTGCTMLHTAENMLDEMGADTGAEAVADFIRRRDTAGSYHDLVDSDSWIHLVEWWHGAFHDGTGSNNWALSLSFACRTSDWRRMSATQRRGFLRNGARAFAAQQAYRRSIGAPLTELRYITKAQSDAGMSGFCCHGWRDPDRRSDPGVSEPNIFPFDEFLDECRAALAGITPPEDVMNNAQQKLLERTYNMASLTHQGVAKLAQVVATIAKGADVDEEALAAALAPALIPAVVDALKDDLGLTEEQAEAAAERALRKVLADAATA
jgi:hypothetical protein